MKLRPSRRVANLERTLIRRIFDAAPPDAINLGLGQPDLPTPAGIRLAGIAGIARGTTGYGATAGDPELRQAVAEQHAPLARGPDDVVITVGTQEAVTLACLSLVDPGDEVLVPDPGYPGYLEVVRLAGAVPVPYRLDAANGFHLSVDAIEERLSARTRLVVVTEPSNPTGAFSTAEELTEVARLLADRDVPWLADEIYAGFAYDRPFVSLGSLAPEGGVVVSGLSKDSSMTGWRMGWLAGPPEIITRATAVHQYLVTCASRVSQTAALEAFSPSGRGERAALVERFRRRRACMARELERVPGVRFALPDGAFYFFVDVSRHGPSLEVAERILARKVVTIPGVAFGPAGEGFLRVSFAASEASIVEGVRRMGEVLAP